jgi:hypothetical protein
MEFYDNYEERALYDTLMLKFEKIYSSDKHRNVYEFSINYLGTKELQRALWTFNNSLMQKGFRIRKLKEHDMEYYPEPDSYKTILITRLGYSEPIVHKFCHWTNGYVKYVHEYPDINYHDGRS